MDDYLNEALRLARAQAGVRVMSEEEILTFAGKLAANLRSMAETCTCAVADSMEVIEPKKSIKEKSITAWSVERHSKFLAHVI